MPYVLIDPQETLDYSCDWSLLLDDVGSPSDTIDTSTWSIKPQEGSPQSPDLSGADIVDQITTIKATNGTVGQVYRLSNKIVTAQGRTAQRSVTLRCDPR